MEAAMITGLLVFVRIAAVVAGLPIFGAAGTPRQAILLASFGITLVITPTVPVVAVPEHFGALFGVVALEVLYGSLLALGVRTTFAAVGMAGEVMGQQMGLAMATLFDPLQQESTSALGTFTGWLSGMVFLGSSLHLRVIETLGASFHVIAPGTLARHDDLVPSLVQAVGAHFLMGVQLAGPLLAMVFVINVLVAILARLAPRMNVFFAVGLAATTVAGLLMMWLCLPWVLMVHLEALERAVGTLARLVGI